MLLLLISSIVLFFVARANYLLFHALVEGFAIVVAALIYVLATRTYRHSRNIIFLFLGIAYFHVAVLDFAHMLTYKGMGVFPNFGSDIPTQLWIAGRFVEAASFLAILFLRQKSINRRVTTVVYTLITTSLLFTIMVFRVFPACFVEGEGLTTFKVLSEYIIICVLLGSAYTLYSNKNFAVQGLFKILGVAMIITAASELSFTLYTDVYGIANMIGHMLKIVSYYYVYTGVVALGIDAPYSMMASELKDRALKDELTGLCNRKGMLDLMAKELQQVEQEKSSLGLLMIDLDNFKLINDRYGHLCGDGVLKKFAVILQNNIRENDIACRFGGDEFVVLVRDVGSNRLAQVQQRIQAAAGDWIEKNEMLQGLGISIGASLLLPGQSLDVDSIINIADKNMYAEKLNKKSMP